MGICKTPLNIQYEVADCGVACLAIILNYHHVYTDYNELKKVCDPGTYGLTYEEIETAAHEYKLSGKKQIYTIDTIRKESTPIIILMDHQHYMVFEGIKGDKVYLNDPIQGRIVYSLDEFKQHFSCIGLKLLPGDGFKTTKKPHPVWDIFKNYSQEHFSCSFYLVALFLMSTIPAIIAANYSHIYIDYYLTQKQYNLLLPLIIFMVVFIAVQLVIEACQHFMLKKLQIVINIDINSRYVKHLFKLPLLFFSRRPIGDLINIIHSNTSLAVQLSGHYFRALLALVQSSVFILVLTGYSFPLTCAVLTAIIISFFVSYLVKDKLLTIHTKLRNYQGYYYAITMYLIQLLTPIKTSGKNNYFFGMWLSAFINVQNVQQRLMFFSAIISQLSLLFVGITGVIITSLGCYLIATGEFTVGQLMAYTILAGLLYQPIQTIASFYSLVMSTYVNIERNQSVMSQDIRQLAENDGTNRDELLVNTLTINNLAFRYNSKSPEILKNIEFKIEKQQKIAIVGNSGCGKSTLLNLICGLLTPSQGQVVVNDTDIHQLTEAERASIIIKVAKRSRFIPGNVRLNLNLGNNFNTSELQSAFNKVGILDECNNDQKDINYYLEQEISTLNMGELKQIDIAIALLHNPQILLLDEPFDVLDDSAEKQLVNSLLKMNRNIIVITHRLSYLDLFDKVMWLQNGKLAAFAPHEQLMKQNKDYANFVGGSAK